MYDDMVRKLESQEEDGLEVRMYIVLCTYTYSIAGNFRKVYILHFSRFDGIHKSLFAKLLISQYKCELPTRKSHN